MIKHWIVSLLCGGIEHKLNLRFFNEFLRSVKELVSILLGCCHDYVLKRYWSIWFRDPRELEIWIAMSWVWINQSREIIQYSWFNIYLFFFIILSRETIRYLSFHVDHLWFSFLFVDNVELENEIVIRWKHSVRRGCTWYILPPNGNVETWRWTYMKYIIFKTKLFTP